MFGARWLTLLLVLGVMASCRPSWKSKSWERLDNFGKADHLAQAILRHRSASAQRELVRLLLRWSAELKRVGRVDRALFLHRAAHRLDHRRAPALSRVPLLIETGRLQEAKKLLRERRSKHSPAQQLQLERVSEALRKKGDRIPKIESQLKQADVLAKKGRHRAAWLKRAQALAQYEQGGNGLPLYARGVVVDNAQFGPRGKTLWLPSYFGLGAVDLPRGEARVVVGRPGYYAVDPRRGLLAHGGPTRQLEVRGLQGGSLRITLWDHVLPRFHPYWKAASYQALKFDPQGRYLAAGSKDGALVLLTDFHRCFRRGARFTPHPAGPPSPRS